MTRKPGRPPGSKNSSTANQLKLMREQHDHEVFLAIINAMAKDPELKYYLGIVLGSGTAIFGKLLESGFTMDNFMGAISGADAGQPAPAAADAEPAAADAEPAVAETPASAVSFGWLAPGAVIGTETANMLGALFGGSGSPGSQSQDNLFGFVPNLLFLAGTGFAGLCATVLILKAIFGDEDVATLMGGVGSIAQGVGEIIPF